MYLFHLVNANKIIASFNDDTHVQLVYSLGTAFFVAPNVIATAMHVVKKSGYDLVGCFFNKNPKVDGENILTVGEFF